MRYCCLWIVALSCYGATLETTALGRQFVFLEEAVSRTDNDVRYWLRGSGSWMRLTADSIQVETGQLGLAGIRFGRGAMVSRGADRIGARVHRYRGAEETWSRELGAWREVTYADVAPGMELRIRPDAREGLQVGLRLQIEAGARLEQFALEARAGSTVVNAVSGVAQIVVSAYMFRLQAPVAWQEIRGQRVPVAVRFVSGEPGTVRFEAGSYDTSQRMYVETALADGLLWLGTISDFNMDARGNTFLGGTLVAAGECGRRIGGARNPCTDTWVAGFRPDGEAIFISWLEGSFEDSLLGLRLRTNGELILVGNTASADFPVSSQALQKQNSGPLGPTVPNQTQPAGDLFLARMDAASGVLLYATYWGGPTKGETGLIEVSATQTMVLVHNAQNSAQGWQPQDMCAGLNPNVQAPALLQFDAGMTRLEKSSYLPPAFYEAMELHRDGSVYVLGNAFSAGPCSATGSPGAYSTERRAPRDGLLLRLSPDLSRLLFATFYGGANNTEVTAMAIDEQGQAYVAGISRNGKGKPESVIAQFSEDGSRRISNRIVKQGWIRVYSMSLRGSGQILVTGLTDAMIGNSFIEGLQFGRCQRADFYSGIAIRLEPDGRQSFGMYFTGYTTARKIAWNDSGEMVVLDVGQLVVNKINFAAPARTELRCLASAASGSIGDGISPGQIVRLVGSGMGPEQGREAGLPNEGKYPTELDGVRVKINGIAAPLLYVQASQINAVVPYEGVRPGERAVVELEYQGKTASHTLGVILNAVDLFTVDSSGLGQIAALNENGSLNSEENPAAVGSVVVVYGTGIGTTVPASVTGAVAGAPFAQPIGPVVAYIAGKAVEVLYAGAAPGLVNGAAQFNLRVPDGVSGVASVDIRVNGSAQGSLPTIVVR